ncbi:MAG TPA: hypothetical protein VM689_02565 [Aliidongia sp.]|nr:hypothetical protein [Aliidongia sp.]
MPPREEGRHFPEDSHATETSVPLRIVSLLATTLLLLAGCDGARSISNAGFPAASTPNFAYRGELTELDLLGLPENEGEITDARIAAELDTAKQVNPLIGKPIMAIQSGAMAPDGPMMEALFQSFPVASFSGLPPPRDHAAFSRELRLTAARGGIRQILCYWGVLETARTNEATKLVSWIPLVGSVVPDQSQKMRIRLKAILMDVATGHWRMLATEPAEDERLSASLNRRSSDQDQVELLKAAGYKQLVRELVSLG